MYIYKYTYKTIIHIYSYIRIYYILYTHMNTIDIHTIYLHYLHLFNCEYTNLRILLSQNYL